MPQFSVVVRNAQLDAIETAVGTSAILRLRTGAQPASCATADSGTVIATINLPADWMSAASGGIKALLGSWVDASADAAGTAGHYRIYDSGGTVCHMQGTAAQTGAELNIDNATLTAGQQFSITSFSLTAGNA